MSLRLAVAEPFRQRGTETLAESEFVVALSLDRDWFSPDQAKRLVDVATGEGLLERDDDELRPTFDPNGVDVPEDFVPDEDVLRERSTFERVLEALVDAGAQKHEAVAGINDLQQRLAVSVEAAAIVYGRREGVAVSNAAASAMTEIEADAAGDPDAAVEPNGAGESDGGATPESGGGE